MERAKSSGAVKINLAHVGDAGHRILPVNEVSS